MWKYILIIVVLFTLFGCDTRTTDPEDGKHAWLHVYYTDNLIYDEVLDETDNNQSIIINLPDDSQTTIEKFVNINYDNYNDEEEVSREYIIWAKKADYYTQFNYGGYLDTLNINASGGFTPVIPGRVCGTIFSDAYFPISFEEFYVLQDSVIVDSFSTSYYGYFDVDIPFGNYQLAYCCNPTNSVDFEVNSFYGNYTIFRSTIWAKPNIYIYPEEKTMVSLSIVFPHGGVITNSIPKYGHEWNDMTIESSGLINNQYSYLFYESKQPETFQNENGWVISQKNLESFFIQNLADIGFAGQEISDFTDYWIPLLTDYPYYTIYPQYKEQLNKMVELEFSVEPDNLLRLIYTVEGQQDNSLSLQNPETPDFKREGFFVVEWGVSIRSNSTLSMNK